MEIREIESKYQLESFLARVKPHTFLCSWNWGETEEKLGHKTWRLGVYDSEALIAVATFSKTVARRGTYLVGHHSPIVDPAFSSMEKLEQILKIFRDKIIEIAKAEHCHFIRLAPIQIDTPEHRALFAKLGFRNAPIHLHAELAWILDVTSDEETLQKNMRKNTRYAIRKAEKDGVEITSSASMEDFPIFWKIYMETAARQQFTPYSEKTLRAEFESFMKDGRGLLWFGKYQGEYIATAFIVYTKNSGYYHHGASLHHAAGISASELLQWRAIQEAKRRGCDLYDFWGVVPEDAIKHPWYGLSRFKRGFGGAEEARVHAQDYVLSSRYWLNFGLETYRKWKRGV